MLQQGSIVWVTINDPNGRNPKRRPAVVVSPTSAIQAGEPIVVVAATTQVEKPLPNNRIPLPWHRSGHPVTKLKTECVAVCDWLAEIDQSSIEAVGGVCPQNVLIQILAMIPA